MDPNGFSGALTDNPRSETLDNTGALRIGMIGASLDEGMDINKTFDVPVENLTFSIYDIDSDTGAPWRDQVSVSATFNGNNTAVSLSCGAENDGDGTCIYSIINGNTARAPVDQDTERDDSRSRLDVSIPGPVDHINVRYVSRTDGAGDDQFIRVSNPTYDCGILGTALTMTTTATGESPYRVNLDYTVENFGGLELDDISIFDDLTDVFGPNPDNWRFGAITLLSGPATFDINTGYDGVNDTQLIRSGSSLPGVGSSQSQVATIRVAVDVNVYGSFSNQVDAISFTPANREISDSSTSGVDPDGINNDDNPEENAPTGFDTSSLPVTLSYFNARPVNGLLELEWETDIEFDNIGFEIYAETSIGVRTLLAPLQPTENGRADFPQQYSLTVPDEGYQRLWLVDVSQLGHRRWHGPFGVNQSAGRPIQQAANLNWNLADTSPTNSMSNTGPVAALEVRVDQSGLQRIRYQDLINAGLDLSLGNPGELALSVDGQSVPIWIGGDSLQFSAQTYIDFIGQAVSDSLYTRERVYRLTFGSELVERIPESTQRVGAVNFEASHQASAVFASDVIYDFSSPAAEPWRADELLSFGSPVSQSYQLNLDHWVPGQQQIFKATVFGGTDFLAQPSQPPAADACGNPSPANAGGIPDHCIRLKINGHLIGEAAFDGLVPAAIEEVIASGFLQDGINQVELQVPGEHGYPFDLVRLESLRIDYARSLVAESGNWSFVLSDDIVIRGDRLFDAGFEQQADDNESDPASEAVVGGFSIDNLPGSDFVAYGFADGTPIRLNGAEWRQGQILIPNISSNRQYWVADTSQITSPGLVGVESDLPALFQSQTEYLMVAHPVFLEATQTLADFHRARGLNVSLVDVEQVYAQYGTGGISPDAILDLVRDVAKDGRLRYILLIGGDTYDYFNNLGLNSVSHIPSIYGATDDIIRYAPLDPLYGDVDGDEIPDIAVGRLPVRSNSELVALIEKIVSFVPAENNDASVHFVADAAEPQYDYAQTSSLLAETLPQSWTVTSTYRDHFDVAADARNDLITAINGSPNLVAYLGHSGPRTWFRQPLFNADDTGLLTNETPNVVIQWGCWNSYYVSPQADTMGHSLLLAGAQGAATVLGAAALTGVASETAFAEQLMPALAVPGIALGDAVLIAKRALAQSSIGYRDIVLGWTILGDPAIRITNP